LLRRIIDLVQEYFDLVSKVTAKAMFDPQVGEGALGHLGCF
jgi:hypothetical protein